MRLGSFELIDPVPNLKAAHALAILRPWVDVGSAGTLTLSWLEAHFGAKELGRLTRPGNFFDFTRYRPIMYLKEGGREVVIPNSVVTYAKRETGDDFVFLHLLEPHMLGELYVNSVLLLLERLGVQRYCLLGSMYDMVPHTRPLLVTGGATDKHTLEVLERAEVRPSDYEGPTTIAYLISQQAPKVGIETMSLIVHLPQYTQLDEDYVGQARLLEVLCSLYNLPMNDNDIQKAEQQRKDIDIAVDKNPQVKAALAQLEAHYDARMVTRKEEEMPPLSPEIERFLKEMEKRFR